LYLTGIDPDGVHLREAVRALDGDRAFDDDLVCIYYTARPFPAPLRHPCSLRRARGNYDLRFEDGEVLHVPLGDLRRGKLVRYLLCVAPPPPGAPAGPDVPCRGGPPSWTQLLCGSLARWVVACLQWPDCLRLEMAASAARGALGRLAAALGMLKPLTPDEEAQVRAFEGGSHHMVVHFRVKQIVCTGGGRTTSRGHGCAASTSTWRPSRRGS